MGGPRDDVIRRLAGSGLDAETRDVVTWACEAAGEPGPASAAAFGADGPAMGAPVAHLRSITVEGFRGIGPKTTLSFPAGRGLTLVVGRNGSGKSSFAEALELLLTGDSRRWYKRTSIWKEGWQNLHQAGDTAIRAEFDVAGLDGPLSVWRAWPKGAGVDKAPPATAQVKGQPQRPYSDVGWEAALSTFRPFLSYNELGSILDEGPSKLFDALSTVLGLDDLVDVADRVTDARKAAEQSVKEVSGRATLLRSQLGDVDDDRAAAAVRLLAAKSPDLEALDRLVEPGAAGDAEAGADVTTLRRLAGLVAPGGDGLAERVGRLREAADDLETATGTDAGEARELAELLDAAVAWHEHRGGEACPVCGSAGVLGETWRQVATARVAELHGRAETAEFAVRQARTQLAQALTLFDAPPAVLKEADVVGVDARPALEAWDRWTSWDGLAGGTGAVEAGATALRTLAEHLEAAGPPLASAVDRVAGAAAALLQQREDVWRPAARQLRAWLDRARAVAGAPERVKQLKAAEAWVKAASADIRDERFAPIADAAKAYWDLLRQQSNVELGRVALTGQATARKVVLDVTVDGVGGAALGVMSQGELHALALSLFLPRATLAESPFRFLVIDDPVQSMDPARVDGLARVLEEAARDRQVIVFTHDDRLPESVRRLGIDARVLEVTRRVNSVVEIRKGLDPVSRSLEDARALALTKELPSEAARRVVPGLCRLAVEARCDEVVWRRRLARGASHGEVEAALADADRLYVRTALALFDDTGRTGDVLNRLNRMGPRAGDAFMRCNKGAHEADAGDLVGLVNDTQFLVDGLEALS
jgi:recombinational DNA repair ATPase RecF